MISSVHTAPYSIQTSFAVECHLKDIRPSLTFSFISTVQVPQEYAEEDVREHFGQFGAIEFINMVKDKQTQKPKGQFSDPTLTRLVSEDLDLLDHFAWFL